MTLLSLKMIAISILLGVFGIFLSPATPATTVSGTSTSRLSYTEVHRMMQEYSRNYESGNFDAACDLYVEHNSTVTWTNGRNGEKTKDEDTRVGKEDIKDKFKWLWSVGATKLKFENPIVFGNYHFSVWNSGVRSGLFQGKWTRTPVNEGKPEKNWHVIRAYIRFAWADKQGKGTISLEKTQKLLSDLKSSKDLRSLFKENVLVGVDNETGNYWDAQSKLKEVGFSHIELQDNIVKFAPSSTKEAGLACVEYDDQDQKWKFAALSIRDPSSKIDDVGN